MSGFGLYETLRILVPGGLAAAAVSLVLRLAAGEGPLLADGRFASTINALQGASFLLVAVSLGFLLYLVDLPTRARIYTNGDPQNHIPLPSNKLRDMIDGSSLARRSLSLYFLLSDAHLPTELHRRIYFFGGIYRIFFDARLITGAGVIVGGVLAGASATPGIPKEAWQHLLMVIALLAFALFFIGTAQGRQRASHKAKYWREQLASGAKAPDQAAIEKDYKSRRNGAITTILPATIAIVVLGTVSAAMATSNNRWWQLGGFAGSVAVLCLWGATEMGPPTPEQSNSSDKPYREPTLRQRVLRRLSLPGRDEAQYLPIQRGTFDLAAFTPSLLVAGLAAHEQSRSAAAVLLWALLLLPAVIVMAMRKHEIRLLNAYQDQLLWLTLNEQKIKEVADRNGLGPNDWY